MIERINTKHALLVAQRGQLEQAISQANANLNATIGAIAACEELRAEILADQSKAAAAAVVEAANVPEAVVTYADPDGATMDRLEQDVKQPEMLPVAKFEPCMECISPDCEERGHCCCDFTD